MIVNVVLNITLVQIIGISGIILSTVFSLLVSIPWENYTIFRYVFHRSSKPYYGKMFLSAGTMLLAGAATLWGCSLLGDSIPAFVLKGCICLVVPNAIFAVLNCKRTEFHETIAMAQRILKKQY